MGVAALDFPKGLEFSNSHQFFYIPSRKFPALKPLLGICSQITQHFDLIIIPLLIMY